MEKQTRAMFYDSYRAALRDDCKAAADNSPGWAKEIGHLLKPGKDPLTAGRWLSDCTHPDRDDRLSDEDERLIMRLSVQKRGFSAAHDYITDEIGMERSKPKDRVDEASELLARSERLLTEFKVTTERFERAVRSPLALAASKKSA